MLNSVFRIILYVEDMETMVRFYRDKLGLVVKAPKSLEDYSEAYWVEFETGACTLILHGGGQKRHGADAPRFSFAVDDVESVRTTLIERGINMGEIRNPAPGSIVCNGVDPEGNHFSIDAVSST